ncbi:chorismate mutase [Peptoniphilus asaccharolyticus DSM 20463]|uniref:Chorismate mutase n=1 Tax=Peptoniphilus asaccharolyticus DSM 20463 TaxID=573058 RepID=A0A1W1VE02_PEPAS|nr:chorismate mutase [Peptoniphilus asaccharolyticus]SMB91555.1 chorismate mutase [Peptoniphilus asaccharolyticus DSM 20463]
MNDLEKMRIEIDEVDRKIVELFEERIDIAKRIGAWKKENGIEIFDSNREEKVIEKAICYLKDKSQKSEIADLFHKLMDISKDIQK